MELRGEYRGIPLEVRDSDLEHFQYFQFCGQHDFRLQRCDACALLRYPPTTACPWCGNLASTWAPVEGKGTVHSYTQTFHAVQAAFKDALPYVVLLVELDTQRGVPNEHAAIRVVGNLVTADGELAPPEVQKKVGIGSRVRMVLRDVGEGLAIPQWTLDETAEAGAGAVWRYPGG